jgi:hypothetical protein
VRGDNLHLILVNFFSLDIHLFVFDLHL